MQDIVGFELQRSMLRHPPTFGGRDLQALRTCEHSVRRHPRAARNDILKYLEYMTGVSPGEKVISDDPAKVELQKMI